MDSAAWRQLSIVLSCGAVIFVVLTVVLTSTSSLNKSAQIVSQKPSAFNIIISRINDSFTKASKCNENFIFYMVVKISKIYKCNLF